MTKGKISDCRIDYTKKKTGAALPKEKSYIKHSSALAKWAKEKGYYIEEVESAAKIEREIVFKKRGNRK